MNVVQKSDYARGYCDCKDYWVSEMLTTLKEQEKRIEALERIAFSDERNPKEV